MQTELEMVRTVFRAESTELLEGLEQRFLALETSFGAEVLEEIFRSIHTFKGNSSMLGFPAASELAHTLEDLVEKLAARAIPMTSELATLLLQSVDALRLMIGVRLEEGKGADLDPGEISWRLAEAAQVAAPAERAAQPEQEHNSSEAPITGPAPGRTLRVGLDRLDRMLDLTGEIAIARGRLSTMLEQAGRYTPQELLEAHREADRLYLDLQELVMKSRLVPIARAFQPFSRTMRDLSASTGKLLRLEVSGDDVEVDTTVVDLIRDPLTHLVRNAVDHGIEKPEVRKQRGKEPKGTLRLKAFQEAGSIVVQVSDDGGGLDRDRIRERARAVGLLGPTEEREDAELYLLIFAPGFSTAERVTELSGRGIGMDVVKRNIETLRGTIEIDTEAGKGTTISLRLPLTLSILEGFSVRVGEETYVLPLGSVIECVELPEADRRPGRMGVLNLRGHALPYLRLREHFGVAGERPTRENVVVISHGRGQAGLAVDTLLGQGQTVVKSLGKLFQHLPGISGSAILGTGRVALILDVPSLLQKALQPQASAAA